MDPSAKMRQTAESCQGRKLHATPNTKHLFRNTQICSYYLEGMCTRGSSCTFAHGARSLHPLPDLSRTRLCKHYLKGFCKHGETCNYAHGMSVMRQYHRRATQDQLSGLRESGRQELFEENAQVHRSASCQDTVASSLVSEAKAGTVAATRAAEPGGFSHSAVNPKTTLSAGNVAMLAGQLRELMQLRQFNEQLRQHNELMAKVWQAREQILEGGTESGEPAAVEFAPSSSSRASTEFEDLAAVKFTPLAAYFRASTEFEEPAAVKFAPLTCSRASTDLLPWSRASSDFEEPAAVKFAPLTCSRASTDVLPWSRASSDFEEPAAVRFAPLTCSRASTDLLSWSRASIDFEEPAAVKFAPLACSRASTDLLPRSRASIDFEEPAAVEFAPLACSRASTDLYPWSRASTDFEELVGVKFGSEACSQAGADFEEVAAINFAPSHSSRASNDCGELAARKLGPASCLQGASSISIQEGNLVSTPDTDPIGTDKAEEHNNLIASITVKNTFIHMSECPNEVSMSRSRSAPARL